MRWRDIAREFDAVLIDAPARSVSTVCIECSRVTAGYVDGRECLCRPCTLRDLGLSEIVLSLSVEFRKSANVITARLEKYGPPMVSPKEWVTPKQRRKGERGG